MFQKTFISEKYNLDNTIQIIKNSVAGKQFKNSVMFIFPEIFNESELAIIIKQVCDSFPNTSVFGVTNHYASHTHLDYESGIIILSLICFEDSNCEYVLSDLSENPECSASFQVVNSLKNIRNPKGIFLFSAGRNLNAHFYMQSINQKFPDVPIFGFSAATKTPNDYTSFTFANEKIIKIGFLAVIFYGEKLCLFADEEFGWTPLGKKMTITKVSEFGKTVHEIDNQPAANLYKKYFGLNYDQVNIENSCEFPIYRRVGKRTAARICSKAEPDGSVRFAAPFNQGDEIQLSYGNPDEIFKITKARAKLVSAFSPQALFLICCMNRIIFLGKDQEKEIDYFRASQKELAVTHGNSEFFYDKKGGSELNSALVYIAMREGNPTQINSTEISQYNYEEDSEEDSERKIVHVPFMRRLLTFLDATTQELEALQKHLSDEVKRKTQEIIFQQQKLNETNKHIVMTLSNAIDAKDTYTNGHSRRVAEYSREIARRYGFSESEQEQVYMIGLLHDVGKIGIPDTILNKPGKLTNEEFAIIKTHPSIGAEILKNITEFPEISHGARWHHERYDGRGYPDGLKGDEIPIIAQIISVADAYDAMTSRRSYRSVMLQEKVRSEIFNGIGTQFAPKFATIMLEMIDDDIDYLMRGDLLAS